MAILMPRRMAAAAAKAFSARSPFSTPFFAALSSFAGHQDRHQKRPAFGHHSRSFFVEK
jgi:hypothetical protein